ncbi:excinuclease ABC subunit UvrC [Herbivorax sp. ANBcel31]|uniref:excinuclease ABC subunit UvrC n=1 Tax=Herbivorax sp. ANBcel31 TaxID=3069754 RepID=UPI0027B09D81|nr:excinuclease ABC subunit UvrC [Herbivorax sp. ANBcel31]MDQ2086675.1 excinuclease ABC subunit UvrC [Herbivorax sp. ANBcel31]
MFDIQEELKKIPENPGVYIMKNKDGEIIYIGKAVVLKNRVKQYFNSYSNQNLKVQAMIEQIYEFECIVTDTEIEALILECNLIKKHKPKYNIMLKDDKNYPFIKITIKEDYPRVIITRKVEKDGSKYFGPFTSGNAVKETVEVIKKLFPIKSCNKVFKNKKVKDRPCLNFHIHQCLGPCQGNVSREKYREVILDIVKLLDGNQQDIIKKFEKDMEFASQNIEFEKAAKLRDKIISLRHIAQKQKIVSADMQDQDIIAFAKDQTDSCIQIFFIRAGKITGRKHFIFERINHLTDSELMTSFVKQFYSSSEYIPKEIVMQVDIAERDIIEEWLLKKRTSKVYIKVPKKGEKLRLVEMVYQNAIICLESFKERVKNEKKLAKEGLEKISLILALKNYPERIEAYDISNMGSSEIVASMVVFENGLPSKKNYRRFKIKSIDGQNDYASMQEVIYRRFTHVKKHKIREEKESFAEIPNLILVDGGTGHVNSVRAVLKELNILNIPVIGMVKDKNHRTRGLTGKNFEFDLSSDFLLLRFITSIQDEAHRFALEYSKKLRKKRYSGSVLDNIEGIGQKRKKALIRHFGSLKKIKFASVSQLSEVEGISRELANNIYEYFKQ